MLPPPDISATYVDEKNRPSREFYNWIRSLYDTVKQVSGREVLQADRTFFIRSSGSDSNPGLTVGGAFLTIQHAINVIGSTLDITGHIITINVGPGSFVGFSTSLSPGLTGGGNIFIQGAGTGLTTITALAGSGACIGFNLPTTTYFSVDKVTIDTNIAGSIGMLANVPGSSQIGDINFGSADIKFTNSGGGASATAILINAPFLLFLVPGAFEAASSFNSLINISNGGQLDDGAAWTISGTPTWTTAAVQASNLSSYNADGSSFVGAANGVRYLITTNAVVNTHGGGANFFPGIVAGSTATGGQYA